MNNKKLHFSFSSNTFNTFFFLKLGDDFHFLHHFSHHHPIVDEERKTRSLISHGTTIFFQRQRRLIKRGLVRKMKEEKPQNMKYSLFSHHLHFVIDNQISL